MKAVILAGGEGTRLRPYTTVLPKPLMPVGNYPIAEIIVRQLAHVGFRHITFAVGYLSQLIEAYFSNGQKWGLEIDYIREDQPLGTAGPLARLPEFDEPVLVLNGDVLTDLRFDRFYQQHLDCGADLSIAGYQKDVKIDLGVLQAGSDCKLVDYHEKPEYDFQVSMGVYVFSPVVQQLIPTGQRFDFPDLVKLLLGRGRAVQVQRHTGLWLDIGRGDDFQLATELFEGNRKRLLPEIRGRPETAATRVVE
jgi:NDP-sugar pyrophosphorylase family protein